jgi:hypothetical protein
MYSLELEISDLPTLFFFTTLAETHFFVWPNFDVPYMEYIHVLSILKNK